MKQIVYISSPESQQIHIWQLNINGTLTLIQVVDVPGYGQPMVINPNKQFLYIGVRPEFRIITYHISQDNGLLKLAKEFPVQGSPSHISTDHKGNFLFSTSYNAACINVIRLKKGIPIETIGILNKITGCHSANISPNNRILWVPALTQDCIYLFQGNHFKSNWQKTKKLQTTKGAGPRHMVFHPNHQYAYVINELHSSIDVWQLRDQYTNIKLVQTINIMPDNFTGTNWASDIHITPNGCHLYACDRTSSILTILNISNNGRSLQIKGFQSTEIQPRGFNIDNCGKFLIIAGQKTNHITIYEIINTKQGILKEKGRYPVGQGPIWILINAQKDQ